ncbi:MAG: type I-C CRISPR-associated protein Cas5c [Nitrospirae bacterium]|nr:type I-C CRISPR-associated protein Cas5c [Nitrospirota bacterium]
MRDSPVFKSNAFRLKVWGRNACFTRPEMKVERVSYDVMTPSAARGILEAILWKPAIRWKVTQIDVLKPIKWESVRRNEVGAVMSPRTSGLFIEDQRQQRAGLLLRDVAYTIHANFEMTDKAGAEDTVVKFTEMFIRRAEKGQCFHRPYLGCREFAAEFEIFTNGKPLPEPIPETRDLGWMLYDISHDNSADKNNQHFCNDNCRPSFFRASLDNGRMVIDESEVRS